MNRGTLILGGVMLSILAGSVWASNRGVGLPQPEREPISIREDSARPLTGGHHRTRYFIGGGIHRGK
ncbi:MAG: hypothetical protein GXP29_09365 [Planctomycetes bacterium]|nr:hypothetical protein [Planctomycetota bacterium]